jgi:misacylated tRNA(Ala) deacylase
MEISPTARLYLHNDHCFESSGTILDIHENLIAFDQTCFYPGGGGQPPDKGILKFSNGETIEIESARADAEEVIWHI